jgi:hypothetical protein
MPFILVGSARHKLITGPHPFAYALFLTDLFRNKRPEVEVYDGAFFIPVVAASCLIGTNRITGWCITLWAFHMAPSQPNFDLVKYR